MLLQSSSCVIYRISLYAYATVAKTETCRTRKYIVYSY